MIGPELDSSNHRRIARWQPLRKLAGKRDLTNANNPKIIILTGAYQPWAGRNTASEAALGFLIEHSNINAAFWHSGLARFGLE